MPDLLVCRACLAYNVPVYNILRTQYQDVFERIAVISVTEHNKPHALCATCLEALDKCCRLLEKSAVSEGILNRLLQQNQLNEDVIKALDRQYHNLVDTLPNFNLEPMRPDEKILEDKKVIDSGLNIEPCGTLKLKDSRNNVTAKIEPVETQNLEVSRDVKDKNRPDQTKVTEYPRDFMVKIDPDELQSSGLTDKVVVKVEPIERRDCFADIEEPATNVTVEETLLSNHTISIETVKVKQTPYIQIDGGILKTIKSEIDSDVNEIVKTRHIPEVPELPENDNLIKKYLEIDQRIDSEFGETRDDKNYLKGHVLASTSSKEFEESRAKKVRDFIENNKMLDGRKIKPVSATKSRANEKLKPKRTTSQSYHCTQCDYQTPFRKRLIYHMKKHVGFVICAVCDYQCATKSRLVSHLRVHTNERPYKCKECNKGFTELGSLSKHTNMHKGVKPYKCMWCVYEAATKNHLDRHIKRHIGDKRFKCELCEYACVQNWDLKRHVKTHENDKARPYKRVTPVVVQTISMAEK